MKGPTSGTDSASESRKLKITARVRSVAWDIHRSLTFDDIERRVWKDEPETHEKWKPDYIPEGRDALLIDYYANLHDRRLSGRNKYAVWRRELANAARLTVEWHGAIEENKETIKRRNKIADLIHDDLMKSDNPISAAALVGRWGSLRDDEAAATDLREWEILKKERRRALIAYEEDIRQIELHVERANGRKHDGWLITFTLYCAAMWFRLTGYRPTAERQADFLNFVNKAYGDIFGVTEKPGTVRIDKKPAKGLVPAIGQNIIANALKTFNADRPNPSDADFLPREERRRSHIAPTQLSKDVPRLSDSELIDLIATRELNSDNPIERLLAQDELVAEIQPRVHGDIQRRIDRLTHRTTRVSAIAAAAERVKKRESALTFSAMADAMKASFLEPKSMPAGIDSIVDKI